MRKGVKVAAWAAVFLACAGVGAYIAAHSDPFPPGVDRPSATGATGSPASPSTSPRARRVGGDRQERDLPRPVRGRPVHHVGGAASSVHVDDEASIDGPVRCG